VYLGDKNKPAKSINKLRVQKREGGKENTIIWTKNILEFLKLSFFSNFLFYPLGPKKIPPSYGKDFAINEENLNSLI